MVEENIVFCDRCKKRIRFKVFTLFPMIEFCYLRVRYLDEIINKDLCLHCYKQFKKFMKNE